MLIFGSRFQPYFFISQKWIGLGSSQVYSIIVGVTQGVLRRLSVFLLYVANLPDGVTYTKIPLDFACNTVIVPGLVHLIATGMWWISYGNSCCSTFSWKVFISAVWKDSSNTRWRSTCYSDRLHDFFVMILRCYKDVNSFFTCTARLQNFFLAEFFHIMCDLNSFKSTLTHFTPLTSFCTPWVPSSGSVERD